MKLFTALLIVSALTLSACQKASVKEEQGEEKSEREQLKEEIRQGDLHNPGGVHDVKKESEDAQDQRKKSIQELDQEPPQQQPEEE